ncbi:MAG: chorismate synthase [Chlamydiae bacterium]|nr:chorismate synthase [Chlamydiota bacterium]
MASNRFGNLFTITTFGESHGDGIGVVIDGCPANLEISKSEIQLELDKRRPGVLPFTSPRKEEDRVEILSGIFQGKTTGAPVALYIKNQDADSSKYESVKNLYKPGHANFTYLEKYGIYDYRGGGRSSARETAARVAAGAIAKKFIYPMEISARVEDIEKILSLLEELMKEGDSIGGVVRCEVKNVIKGLGDPMYQKLEALLASAMLSIPASRGIEFGSGFSSANMKGSDHNDLYLKEGMKTNHHGGILAGITTGSPIVFRVPFKPTSSIKKPQKTIDFEGNEEVFCIPEGSRHDPCVALRAPVIVESMTAIVLADALLMNRCSKI